MAFSISRPHPYKKVGGDFIEKLPPHNYLTLFHGVEIGKTDKGRILYDNQRLYVCEGAVYTNEHDRVPMDVLDQKYPWFWDAYRNVEPELRREARLALPDERIQNADELPDEFLTQFESLSPEMQEKLMEHVAVEKATTWTCDECGEEVPTKSKGVHKINKHPKE